MSISIDTCTARHFKWGNEQFQCQKELLLLPKNYHRFPVYSGDLLNSCQTVDVAQFFLKVAHSAADDFMHMVVTSNFDLLY